MKKYNWSNLRLLEILIQIQKELPTSSAISKERLLADRSTVLSIYFLF